MIALELTVVFCVFTLKCFCAKGAIVVHEVYENGAAARDGRLWAGDQILEVSYCCTCVTLSNLFVIGISGNM